MRRLVMVGGLLASAVWLVVTAGPALSDSSGTVTATIQVPVSACITVSPPSFAYPSSPFSSSGSLVVVTPAAQTTKPIVQGCATGGTQTYLARGAATTGGAVWTLAGSISCPSDVDRYIHRLDSVNDGQKTLTTTDAVWESAVPVGQGRTVSSQLTMPCTGSAGQGSSVSMPILITATVDQ